MPKRRRTTGGRDLAEQAQEVAALAATQIDQLGSMATEVRKAEFGAIAAAAVAHEIKNVLTPVRARLELALLAMGDAALVERSIREALKGIDRASRAAESVLSVVGGRVDTGDGADVAEATVVVSGWVQSGSFTVRSKIQAGLRARMSQVALEQVMLNLLLNAKAAMGGSGVVVVQTIIVTTNKMLLEIEDRGRGMAAAGAFAGGPAAGGAGGKPGGVGLVICRHLVEAVGGSMTVSSRPGAGTVVRVELERMDGAARKAA